MNQGARDLVFSLTGGHPGAVASMLGAIYHVCYTFDLDLRCYTQYILDIQSKIQIRRIHCQH